MKSTRRQLVQIIAAAAACLTLAVRSEASEPRSDTPIATRPNILLIVADDMGFSDLGCYGGEIHTPNIDKLAANGIRFRQFYNASRCCPSRASLLTGQYPHKAGMGWMTVSDLGQPGYIGELNEHCVTLAQCSGPPAIAATRAANGTLSSTSTWGPTGRRTTGPCSEDSTDTMAAWQATAATTNPAS